MRVQMLEYSDKCFQSLVNSLLSVGEVSTIETVHKLRLSIKQLHALFNILDYSDGSRKKSKILIRIDSLFLSSGNLREIQVQIELLRKYRKQVGVVVDKLIANLLQEGKRIEKRHKEKIAKVNSFDITLLNQRLDNAIEGLDDRKIDNILRAKADALILQIFEMCNENLDETKLHRIRIILRELIYNFSIVKKSKIKLRYSSSFIRSVNNLQQDLGVWHDLKVLSDRMVKAENLKGELVSLLWLVENDKNSIQKKVIDDLLNLSLVICKIMGETKLPQT